MKIDHLRLVLITIVVILAVGIFVWRWFAQEEPGEFKIYRSLSYGPHNNHAGNLLDIYLPNKGTVPYPVVVWIHGGGWRNGDKYPAPYVPLVDHGFAVASINYRLSKEAKFPAQLDDCLAAIIWLRAHAQEYKIDPNRIGVWGASSGGHLAALIGTGSGAAGPTPYVKSVCDWSGITDLLSLAAQAGADGKLDNDTPYAPVTLFIGDRPKNKVEIAKLASPVFWANNADPPFLIMHGDIDDIVPFAQSQELNDALKAKGVKVQFISLPEEGHHIYGDKNFAYVLHFFQRTLRDLPKTQ